MTSAGKASVFVSHASADIVQVRAVRNYLEDKDAIPILFHLMGTDDPAEFWPLIEREIKARNFFLYCESPAADASSWVQRERELVRSLATTNPKRVGNIRVDQPKVDHEAIDRFLKYTRVFVNFEPADSAAAMAFVQKLRVAGFVVAHTGDLALYSPENFSDALSAELQAAAFLVFFANEGASAKWIYSQLEQFGRALHKRTSAIDGLLIVASDTSHLQIRGGSAKLVSASEALDILLTRIVP